MQHSVMIAAFSFIIIIANNSYAQEQEPCVITDIKTSKKGEEGAHELIFLLNKNFSCISQRLHQIEQDIKEIKSSLKHSDNLAIHQNSYAQKTQAGGIESTLSNVSLSPDKEGITSDIQLKNLNSNSVNIIFIKPESSINIPGIAQLSPIAFNGAAYCNLGASSCILMKDEKWTVLEPNQTFSMQIAYKSKDPIKTRSFSISLKFLLNNGEDKKPYNFSFHDISLDQ